jgi:two-component system, chemotaxis family, CheB/CheR fusion protein
MILSKTDTLPQYARLLRGTPAEVQALHDDLLIGVTSFFRDPGAFDTLARTAYPELVSGRHEGEPLRIWVLGCSTGEEAYSLAIAVTEWAEGAGIDIPLQIFASDVNPAGIAIARRGAYPLEIANDVSPERLRRFFVPVDGHFRIIKSIRDDCVFSRHNVLTDPPFSRIDFVSCRNLLMYFESVLQRDVIRSLHYALRPGGVLWLGSADSIGAHHELFDTSDAESKIFIRRPGPAAPVRQRSTPLRAPAAPRPVRGPAEEPVDVLSESDRVLLSRFAPAGVLLSPSLEILQYRGDVGPYIAPAAGRASLNLMQVLDPQLQLPVRAAIARARIEMADVRETGVRFATSAGSVTMSIAVVRIGPEPSSYLVLFDDGSPRTPPEGFAHAEAPTVGGDGDQLARITKELADTRAYLQSVIEAQELARQDLESAHEEAQSANEELQSVNEELETSKEEIQSANEELTTLNEELQHRNSELQRTNSDLENLLSSSHLAVVFVGPDLSIRRFTYAAGRMVHLRPGDIGRPLRDLRLGVALDFEAHIGQVMQTRTPWEHDLQDDSGRWLSVRIRPYTNMDNQVDGAVVVLVDIDAVIRARHYAESIIATVRTPLVVLDEQLNVVTANGALRQILREDAPELEGRSFFEIDGRRWDEQELHDLLDRVLPANALVSDFKIATTDGQSGTKEMWLLNARRLVQSEPGRPLILLSLEDVSDRERTDELRRQRLIELASADHNRNEFLAMLAHELRNPLAPIRTAALMVGAPGVSVQVSDRARMIIGRQVEHMTRLIDDLLNAARITQGKIELQQAPLDLVPVLRRAVEIFERTIQERSQQLSVMMPEEPLIISGDATRLEQAFGNLLSNASKYTSTGGRIWLGTETKESNGGTDVIVSVRDDGIGVSEPMLAQIFDLFRQGAPSPHRVTGLGVGLALVRRIVELHGGRVTVQSAGLQQGSEFSVCLPMLNDPSALPEPDVGERAPSAAGLHILVVDDNIDAAETLTSLLRQWGYDARMVADGPAALSLAPVFLPAVVLLDLGMPEMDGYQVARTLRGMAGLEDTLLVAVTGFGRDEDRRMTTEAGFDAHLTKPVDPAVLPQLLATRISKSVAPPSDG